MMPDEQVTSSTSLLCGMKSNPEGMAKTAKADTVFLLVPKASGELFIPDGFIYSLTGFSNNFWLPKPTQSLRVAARQLTPDKAFPPDHCWIVRDSMAGDEIDPKFKERGVRSLIIGPLPHPSIPHGPVFIVFCNFRESPNKQTGRFPLLLVSEDFERARAILEELSLNGFRKLKEELTQRTNPCAFEMEREDLLKNHAGAFAAYHKGELVDTASTKRALIEKLKKREIVNDKTLIAKIEPPGPPRRIPHAAKRRGLPSRNAEQDINAKAFMSDLPDLLCKHVGRFAAYHNGQRLAIESGKAALLDRVAEEFPNQQIFVGYIEPLAPPPPTRQPPSPFRRRKID